MEIKTIQESIERYKKSIAVNNAMRRAFERIAHHQKLTKKIETEFKKEFPTACVHYNVDSLTTIRIWGGDTGLTYDDGLYYCMNNANLAHGWQEYFQKELVRMDNSDSLENLEHELGYYAELEKIEHTIAQLQERAQEMKKDGYIPKAADPDCRGTVHFWHEFSYTTKAKFPLTFNYRER